MPGSQAYTAQEAIGAAMEQEMRLASGSVKLELALTPEGRRFSWPEAFSKRLLCELGDGTILVYRWNNAGDWFVAVDDKNGNRVRELACDDRWIYDRDAVWDIRFLKEKYSASDAPEDLEAEFTAIMWPFGVAAESHMFPLSEGRTDFTLIPGMASLPTAEIRRESSTLERITIRRYDGPTFRSCYSRAAEVGDVLLHGPHDSRGEFTTSLELQLDPSHGHSLILQGPLGTQDAPALGNVREDLLEVEEGLFVPKRHKLITHGDSVLLTSSLVEEESRFFISDSSVHDEPKADEQRPRHIWRPARDDGY